MVSSRFDRVIGVAVNVVALCALLTLYAGLAPLYVLMQAVRHPAVTALVLAVLVLAAGYCRGVLS